MLFQYRKHFAKSLLKADQMLNSKKLQFESFIPMAWLLEFILFGKSYSFFPKLSKDTVDKSKGFVEINLLQRTAKFLESN